MAGRQLSLLFICRLVIIGAGGSLLPVLPLYAEQLGADPAVTGYYLASAFAALTAGTLLGGWLVDRLRRVKPLLVSTGLAGAPAIFLMGRATGIWGLLLLTGIVWFVAGIGFSLVFLIAARSAGPGQRGRVFGVLEISTALGSIAGGLTLGPLVDRWGFSFMFAVAALAWLFYPLAGSLLAERPADPAGHVRPPGLPLAQVITLGLALLLLSGLLTNAAAFAANLGIPLAMNARGFSAGAITIAWAIGGVVALPLPLLAGSLSDRWGRKRPLILAYAGGALAMLLLAGAQTAWQFWLVAALVYLMQTGGRAIGSALVTDQAAPGSLGTAISLFGASGWVGAIAGFALTGLAVQEAGMAVTFIAATVLPLLAIGLVIPIGGRRQAAILSSPK